MCIRFVQELRNTSMSNQIITIIQSENLITKCEEFRIETPLIYSSITMLKQISMNIELTKIDLQTLHYIKLLENSGLLLLDGDQVLVSSKGNSFLESIENEVIISNNPLSITTPKLKQKAKEQELEWTEDWMKLWKNDRNIFFKSGTRSLRGTKRDVESNFATFFKAYDYIFKDLTDKEKKDLIFNATKKYIKDLSGNNFAYGMKCTYFIVKNDTFRQLKSRLAEMIEETIEIGERPAETNLMKKGVFKK